jgi:hypothetical protein
MIELKPAACGLCVQTYLLFWERLAIRPATYPPLKPLSILTTTTLAEQLLSMVRSAASPPKDAP